MEALEDKEVSEDMEASEDAGVPEGKEAPAEMEVPEGKEALEEMEVLEVPAACHDDVLFDDDCIHRHGSLTSLLMHIFIIIFYKTVPIQKDYIRK